MNALPDLSTYQDPEALTPPAWDDDEREPTAREDRELELEERALEADR